MFEQEALTYILGNPANITITDLEMPVMNGTGLIRKVKRKGLSTPVMVLESPQKTYKSGLSKTAVGNTE